MAYAGAVSDPFSSRPGYSLYLYVRREDTDTANNRSTYAWELSARYNDGGNYSFMLDPKPWGATVEGGSDTGSHNLDFRGGVTKIVLGSGVTGWKTHDKDGYLTVNMSAFMNNVPTFGSASMSGSFAADRIAQVPDATTPIAVDNITETSMRYRFSGNGNGGSSIIRWEYQYSTSSSFASGNSAVIVSNGTSTATGLTGGTRYYFRSRGVNAVGNGPWSTVLSGMYDMPEVPNAPTAKSLDQITIDSMRYTFTTNGDGGSPITKSEFQYSTSSSFSSPVTVTSTGTSTVSGLKPGTKYYFRSRSVNAVGNSSWSSVLNATTLTGAYAGVGGSFVGSEVLVGVGGGFVTAEVWIGDPDTGTYVLAPG